MTVDDSDGDFAVGHDCGDVSDNDVVERVVDDDEQAFAVHINSQPISLIDEYMVHLLRFEAIFFLDAGSILLQDFDESKRSLKRFKFCVVRRIVILFHDGPLWLYFCSCNRSRQAFVSALSKSIPKTSTEFAEETKDHHECCHIKVCQRASIHYDGINQISPNDFLEGLAPSDHGYFQDVTVADMSIMGNKLIYIEMENSDFGVIGSDQKGFVCHTCSFGCHNCCHIDALQTYINHENELSDYLQDFTEKGPDFPNHSFKYSLAAETKCPIPWRSISSQRAILSNKIELVINHANEKNYLPADSLFDHCQECSASFTNEINWSHGKKLYMRSQVVVVSVPERKCNCGNVQKFDGTDIGILNMGNFLVGHDVLRDYMYQFLSGHSRSLTSFLDCWKYLIFDATGSPIELLNYHNWRMAWYAFLELLNIDFKDGFCCPICGQYPTLLTCDATTLSFKRQFLKNVTFEAADSNNELLDGSRFRQRMLIEEKHIRKLLFSYTSEDYFDDESHELLLVELLRYHPVLHSFIIRCEVKFGDRTQLPQGIHRLLKCFGQTSPVCSYFPASTSFMKIVDQLLNGLVITKHPSMLGDLQKLAPIFFDAIVSLPDDEPLTNSWKALLCVMKNTHIATFPKRPPHLLESVTENFQEKLYKYFPNWPQKCVRGTYVLDRSRSENPEQCFKKAPGHPNLLPGIFTVYCMHDICYGFDVMESVESPNVPFTIFRTRFPSAPGTIVYDNACNLHAYCLNRDPVFFKESLFVVDRFHWKNHKGCASSYNISLYPSLADVNSQINEQRNSMLKRLKSQLSYMQPNNFFNHCRLFLWHLNMQTLAKNGLESN